MPRRTAPANVPLTMAIDRGAPPIRIVFCQRTMDRCHEYPGTASSCSKAAAIRSAHAAAEREEGQEEARSGECDRQTRTRSGSAGGSPPDVSPKASERPVDDDDDDRDDLWRPDLRPTAGSGLKRLFPRHVRAGSRWAEVAVAECSLMVANVTTAVAKVRRIRIAVRMMSGFMEFEVPYC